MRLWPGHGELRTTIHEAIAPEVEPQAHHDVKADHRHKLRAIAKEHGKEGDGADRQQHNGGQRVERVFITALDGVQRPFFAEQDMEM